MGDLMLPSSLAFVLHLMITVGLALRLLHRKLAVNTTLAWILILFAVPYVGIGLYFLFGDYLLGRKRMRVGERIRGYYQHRYGIEANEAAREELWAPPHFIALGRAMAEHTGFPITTGNSLDILDDAGGMLEQIVSDIDAAVDTCFLEFYIVEPKGRVELVLEALERASVRGVDCRLLADHFGSKALFRSPWVKRLKAHGVKVIPSLPVTLLKSFSQRTDLRNHRKLIGIDQTVGYVGSFNLVDPKHFKKHAKVGEWVDLMVRLEGDIVDSIGCVFNSDYLFDTVGVDVDFADPEDLQGLPNEAKPCRNDGDVALQLLPSGPEMRDSTVYEWVVSAIFAARHRVSIITPYFIPDEAILLALKAAAKRGVDVEILIPEKIDSRLARFASASVYDELLSEGVRIARYRDGLLHTKALLIDADIAMVGTVNMDTRSFYLNLELTLIVMDEGVVRELDRVREAYLEKCDMLYLHAWRERGSLRQFAENVVRLVGPVL